LINGPANFLKHQSFQGFMHNLINPPSPKLHVFVCINDRTTTRPDMTSCAPTITKDTIKKVKYWIIEQGLTHQILITKTYCLGICPKSGGVMVVYPQGRWVTQIKSAEDIKQVISEEINKMN
jgi:(2Fe-2S) ferredoxin